MSDSETPFTDVLEEHERSSIRGTLMQLAQQHINSHRRSAAVAVDPYMRECSIWIQPGMNPDDVRRLMRSKLGLEEGPQHKYKTSGSNKFKFITCHFEHNRLQRVAFEAKGD